MIALLALAVGVLVSYDDNNYYSDYYSDSDEDAIEKAGKVYVSTVPALVLPFKTDIFVQSRPSLDRLDLSMSHPHYHRNRPTCTQEP